MFLVTLETKDAAKSALLKDLETERAKLQSLQVIVFVVMPPPGTVIYTGCLQESANFVKIDKCFKLIRSPQILSVKDANKNRIRCSRKLLGLDSQDTRFSSCVYVLERDQQSLFSHQVSWDSRYPFAISFSEALLLNSPARPAQKTTTAT